MISQAQWNSLLWLKPTHFKNSDKLTWPVVRNLDAVISKIGSRPVILSDWRPYETERGGIQQHFEGTAIDHVWPGQDPLFVWQVLRDSNLFTGLGIYINEVGAVSFHTDNRTGRTVTNPALWGNFIEYPFDPAQGKNVRKDNYVGAELVIDAIKKKGTTVGLILAGTLIYLLSSRSKKKNRKRKRRRSR